MKNKSNFLQAAQELFDVKEKSADNPEPQEVAEDTVVVPARVVPQKGRENTSGYAVSVLAKGLTVTGQLSAEGSVEISGVLNGNLDAEGDVQIFGTVSGNVKGKTVVLSAARVKGDIEAEDRLSLDDKAVIVGDVNAGSIVLAGRIMGNVKAAGTVVFEQTALLLGDIECAGISVKEGAKLSGKIVMQGSQNTEFEKELDI